jgi:putative transposase
MTRTLRSLEEHSHAKWGDIHKGRCDKLCDFGITTFWSDEVAKISETLPVLPIGEISRIDVGGVAINRHLLIGAAPQLSPQIYSIPHMEYAQGAKKSFTREIKPRKKLRPLFKRWMEQARLVYNKSLQYLRDNPPLSERNLRNTMKPAPNIPNTVFEYAVFEAHRAFEKSRNAQDRTTLCAISIDSRCIKNGFIYRNHVAREMKAKYPKAHKNIMADLSMQLDDFANCGIIKLICSGRRHYLSKAIDTVPKTQPTKNIIALDPGVRTFLEWYDGESYGDIGGNFTVNRLHKALDKINEKISKLSSRKRITRLRAAAAKINKKITNKVKDLHYKAAKFLSDYKTVILPTFKVSKLAAGLPAKVNRKLYALSHFSFKLRLVNKTSEYRNKIIICNEAYTSKTCTKCGVINEKLGSSKVFQCISCHISRDRDYNGARNIFLRVLTQETVPFSVSGVGMIPPPNLL